MARYKNSKTNSTGEEVEKYFLIVDDTKLNMPTSELSSDKKKRNFTKKMWNAMDAALKAAGSNRGGWFLSVCIEVPLGDEGGLDEYYPVFYALDASNKPIATGQVAAPCPPFCNGDTNYDSSSIENSKKLQIISEILKL